MTASYKMSLVYELSAMSFNSYVLFTFQDASLTALVCQNTDQLPSEDIPYQLYYRCNHNHNTSYSYICQVMIIIRNAFTWNTDFSKCFICSISARKALISLSITWQIYHHMFITNVTAVYIHKLLKLSLILLLHSRISKTQCYACVGCQCVFFFQFLTGL